MGNAIILFMMRWSLIKSNFRKNPNFYIDLQKKGGNVSN